MTPTISTKLAVGDVSMFCFNSAELCTVDWRKLYTFLKPEWKKPCQIVLRHNKSIAKINQKSQMRYDATYSNTA